MTIQISKVNFEKCIKRDSYLSLYMLGFLVSGLICFNGIVHLGTRKKVIPGGYDFE